MLMSQEALCYVRLELLWCFYTVKSSRYLLLLIILKDNLSLYIPWRRIVSVDL